MLDIASQNGDRKAKSKTTAYPYLSKMVNDPKAKAVIARTQIPAIAQFQAKFRANLLASA